MTPGKDRRKSGRHQRETPRDALRALSRALAPKTLPTVQTPESSTHFRRSDIIDDLDDDVLRAPRLSLAIDEEDEDDSLLLPPTLAGLEDEDITIHSVEMPRRAISEQILDRVSRSSFGSTRASAPFLAPDTDLSGILAGYGVSPATNAGFEDGIEYANNGDYGIL